MLCSYLFAFPRLLGLACTLAASLLIATPGPASTLASSPAPAPAPSPAFPAPAPTTPVALPPAPAEIIDLHCHIAGIGAGESGCFISAPLRASLKFGFYLRSFGVKQREIATAGDALLVDRLATRLRHHRQIGRTVLLALDGVVDASGQLDRAATEFYVPNAFVAAQVRRHPDVFLYGASINPLRADALLLLDAAKADGAVLIKWLPNVQGFDPADPRCLPFYRRLAALQLPLLVHTGEERAFTTSNHRLGDPERLHLALAQGVTVIAAHAASPGRFEGEDAVERLCRLMQRYPNLYADISTLPQCNKRRALDRVLAHSEIHDRLLYGSDFPLIAIPGLASPWFHVLRLGPRQTWAIAQLRDPWERDLALKRALGFPPSTFTRAATLLRPPIRTASS